MSKVMSPGKRAYSGGRKWKPGSSAAGLKEVFGDKIHKAITETPPKEAKDSLPPAKEPEGGSSGTGSGA